jgi:phosphoenolpyruvate carboxylase
MNEETFKLFGNTIDSLEKVMYATTETIQQAYIESCVKQLDQIYSEIKEEYGYKDSSDEEIA